MSASQCLFCNRDNPQEAKFCNECGSPLHLRPCLQCEAINDAASRACYNCGTAFPHASRLAVDVAPAVVEAASPVRDEAARRITPAAEGGTRVILGLRSMRRLAVALPPLILLGAVAIGSYYAYPDPAQLREWLNTAKAILTEGPDTALVPDQLDKGVAAVSSASMPTGTTPNIDADASAKPLAVNPQAAATTPLSTHQDNVAGPSSLVMVADTTPAQVRTNSGSHATAREKTAATSKKKPSSSSKSRAKNPKRNFDNK